MTRNEGEGAVRPDRLGDRLGDMTVWVTDRLGEDRLGDAPGRFARVYTRSGSIRFGRLMRLSEAIRLGSMLRPQCRGALRKEYRVGFLGLFGEKVSASCALGAAFEAAGCEAVPGIVAEASSTFRGPAVEVGSKGPVIQIPDEWQPVFRVVVHCPQCGEVAKLQRVIAHLNDAHGWTREDIAGFVAGIEEQHWPWLYKPQSTPANFSFMTTDPTSLGAVTRRTVDIC
jgi:hypothetical protein